MPGDDGSGVSQAGSGVLCVFVVVMRGAVALLAQGVQVVGDVVGEDEFTVLQEGEQVALFVGAVGVNTVALCGVLQDSFAELAQFEKDGVGVVRVVGERALRQFGEVRRVVAGIKQGEGGGDVRHGGLLVGGWFCLFCGASGNGHRIFA